MTFSVYENKHYLVCIEKNVTEEDLSKYGEITDKIWDNYSDKNPNHSGYLLKKGIKTYYAFIEKEKS